MPRYVVSRKKTGTAIIGTISRSQNMSFRSCLIKTSSCAIFLGIVIFFRKSRNTTDYRPTRLLRFLRALAEESSEARLCLEALRATNPERPSRHPPFTVSIHFENSVTQAPCFEEISGPLGYKSAHPGCRDETESRSLHRSNRCTDCRRHLLGPESIRERHGDHEVSGDVHPHSFAHRIQWKREHGKSLAGDDGASGADGYNSSQE